MYFINDLDAAVEELVIIFAKDTFRIGQESYYPKRNKIQNNFDRESLKINKGNLKQTSAEFFMQKTKVKCTGSECKK